MSYEMNRGVSQALYKYLPDSWIDFTVRGEERNNFTAYVTRWNSEKLVKINKRRLIRVVNHAVDLFRLGAGNGFPGTEGFSARLDTDNCDVLTPKHDCDERGAVARISPLTFFCPGCHRVYKFRNSDDYKEHRRCRRCATTPELKQAKLVYFCKCGFASDDHPVYCQNCKSSANIMWSGTLNDFKFRCAGCGREIEMLKKCDRCGTILTPKSAMDNSQFFPFSLNLVDIIDQKTENFISGTDYGAVMTIAWWLGRITRDNLADIINNGISEDPGEFERAFNNYFNLFTASGLDEQSARTAATAAAGNSCGSDYFKLADEIRSIVLAADDNLSQVCEQLLEFLFIKEQKDSSTLDDAERISEMLNTNANPKEFKRIAEKYAIKSVQACGDLPFISCSYGYTRKETEPSEGLVLHAFREEHRGIKNIYATKLNTEGVLFELDRKRIIEWLGRNGYIDSTALPDPDNDEETKLWFINNIKPGEIKPFAQIDPAEKATYYVYNLIHTVSHLLIKSAASMCGLDKNSMSEYILPNVPAVMIYCQNSQGFNLGALFNLFEAYFDKWLLNARAAADKCIFDPVCAERYKACAGCMFLNEISCQHFNHDLDRTIVKGYTDRKAGKRYYGFWEV